MPTSLATTLLAMQEIDVMGLFNNYHMYVVNTMSMLREGLSQVRHAFAFRTNSGTSNLRFFAEDFEGEVTIGRVGGAKHRDRFDVSVELMAFFRKVVARNYHSHKDGSSG